MIVVKECARIVLLNLKFARTAIVNVARAIGAIVKKTKLSASEAQEESA